MQFQLLFRICLEGNRVIPQRRFAAKRPSFFGYPKKRPLLTTILPGWVSLKKNISYAYNIYIYQYNPVPLQDAHPFPPQHCCVARRSSFPNAIIAAVRNSWSLGFGKGTNLWPNSLLSFLEASSQPRWT